MFPALASPEESDPEATLVGRISFLEGKLLRFDNDEEQWVEAETDSPFGKGDALSSDKDTRAELMLPNRTWIRIGSTTQIELKELNAVETEVALPAGTARFYNKNADGTLKVTTPFGFVKASRNTSFDVYCDDRAVEVVAMEGSIDFVHKSGRDSYRVVAGSTSLIAGDQEISSGEGVAAKAWDRWNNERDELWAKRLRSGGQSARYLPAPLQDDGYVFDQYGRWENIYYEGGYHYFWRPVYVGVGWSPFTVGRWMMWCGDYTWVPYEPFGYTTHHYGHWVYLGSYWYWAPPFATFSVGYGSPAFFMSFGWYPGRVGWIYDHHYHHIGWVPLLPREPYYCHHRWGRHSRPVRDHDSTNVHVNVRNYSYADHAVIIKQSHFRDRNGYNQVRVRNVGHSTIVNNYEAAPLASSIVPRTINGAHTPGRTPQPRENSVGVSSRGEPRSMPGLVNPQPGVSVKEATPRAPEAPTVKETTHTMGSGSGATQRHTGPVGLVPETKESGPTATPPSSGTIRKSSESAPSRGKIYVPSRNADSAVGTQHSTPDTLQQGSRVPATINQTRESESTKGGASPSSFSGHLPSRPAQTTEKDAASGTRIPQKQAPLPAQEPKKETPAASPHSLGVPVRTNQFRPTPVAPRAQTETAPRNFPSSASPRVEYQNREKTSYGGMSGYVPTPAYQPSPRTEIRVPSESTRVQERSRIESVPAPSVQSGFSSRSGNKYEGSSAPTVRQHYSPHGGMQGYVPQQGKAGGGNSGQSSFGGMRKK